MRTGYYSIIQFVPDLARHEGSNVGVLVYVPYVSKLVVKMSEDNDWPRKMFGEDVIDDARLTSAKRAFANTVVREGAEWRSLADLEHFRNCLANNIQMTPPGVIIVEDLEKDSDDLFAKWLTFNYK